MMFILVIADVTETHLQKGLKRVWSKKCPYLVWHVMKTALFTLTAKSRTATRLHEAKKQEHVGYSTVCYISVGLVPRARGARPAHLADHLAPRSSAEERGPGRPSLQTRDLFALQGCSV